VRSSTEGRNVWRFGAFAFDEGELRLSRNSVLLKLQEQPARILLLLVQRSGQVVTREELRQQLWPGDTFVDFEHGLNTAVKKLRGCLGDSADSPQYIETIPRRGYRFIVPVECTELPASSLAAASSSVPFLRARVAWATAAALLIGVLALLSYSLWRPTAPRPITALAVLPLDDLSEDQSRPYFAEGITDAMITDVAQIEGLRVISRPSVMRYKRVRSDLRKVARELGVDALLVGSVARSDKEVRIRVQLVDGATERQVWVTSYARPLGNELAMQDDIARDIAQQIQLKVARRRHPRAPQGLDPTTQEAYLLGMYYLEQWNRESLLRSLAYFEQATAKDPEFAEAWAGVALVHNRLIGWNYEPRSEGAARSMAAAARAVQLDESLSAAHAAMGEMFYRERHWQEAERELRRAVMLNPNNASAHQVYGYLLSSVGRLDEAIVEMRRALVLDPLSSNKLHSLGVTLFRAGKDDEAASLLRRVPDADANSVRRHRYLAAIELRQGHQDASLVELVASLRLAGKSHVADAVQAAYHRAGWQAAQRTMALQNLDELHSQLPSAQPGEAVERAADYLTLGQRDLALDQLQQAAASYEGGILYISTDARFASLHRDPRFQDLLAQVGITLPQ